MRALAVLLLLLLLAPLAQAEGRPVRFSVIEGWAMPLARIEEGRLSGGILFELLGAIAQKAGVAAEFRLLPRARIEQALESRSIDVRCYIAPAWLERPFPAYRWSAPLLVQRDLLVARDAGTANVATLAPQTIGTVLGYRYPPLQAQFDAGQLHRDDARTQELVLRKLEIGRYRYAVSSDMALHWFNHEQANGHPLYPVAQLAETELGCLVLDAPDVPTQALLDAIAALKVSGEIEHILARYH